MYGDHTEAVAGDQELTIGALRTLSVQHASTETIAQGSKLDIGVGYGVNVTRDHRRSIGGDVKVEVGAARFEAVKGARSEEVGKDSRITIGGDFASDLRGEASISIGADLKEEIAESTEIESGASTSWSAKRIRLRADEFTLIVGGKVVLSLDRAGTLQLNGTSISIEGSAIQLKGSPLSKSAPSALLQKQLQIKKLEALRSAPARASFLLLDLDGAPVIGQAFRVELEDGAVHKGTTSEAPCQIPVSKAGQYKLTFPGEAKKSSEAGSARGALRVELGKAITLATGKTHRLELPEHRSVMTIAFLWEAKSDSTYPRYVLESEDGTYAQELSVKSHIDKKDEKYHHLRFGKLKPGTRYKLTRWLGKEISEIVFEGASYADIVDQHRTEMDALRDAAFARSSRRRALSSSEQEKGIIQHHELDK